MKAVVTERSGDYDVMRVADVPIPVLGPREALVRNFASGVCYHDHLIRAGVMKRGITFPLILGHEGAGIVQAVGSAVRSLTPGTRVACAQWTENCGLGLLGLRNMSTALILLPLAPLGVWRGLWLARRIGSRWFYRIAYAGMFCTGVKLLWDGLA